MCTHSYFNRSVLTGAAEKCRVSENWINHQFSRLVVRTNIKANLPLIAECVLPCDRFSGATILLIHDGFVHSHFPSFSFKHKISIDKFNDVESVEAEFDLSRIGSGIDNEVILQLSTLSAVVDEVYA